MAVVDWSSVSRSDSDWWFWAGCMLHSRARRQAPRRPLPSAVNIRHATCSNKVLCTSLPCDQRKAAWLKLSRRSSSRPVSRRATCKPSGASRIAQQMSLDKSKAAAWQRCDERPVTMQSKVSSACTDHLTETSSHQLSLPAFDNHLTISTTTILITLYTSTTLCDQYFIVLPNSKKRPHSAHCLHRFATPSSDARTAHCVSLISASSGTRTITLETTNSKHHNHVYQHGQLSVRNAYVHLLHSKSPAPCRRAQSSGTEGLLEQCSASIPGAKEP